jgi:hypothetical protein
MCERFYTPGGSLMFYTIWKLMPRPRHFPDDPRLERLLNSNFDPAVGAFKIRVQRRHARDLRKGLFGPEGGRNVPSKSGGVRTFDLPNGWILRLTYHAVGTYTVKWRRLTSSDVDAEFIPPTVRADLPVTRNEQRPLLEEARL